MNYGISILFRAIPLAMAAFCFAYGAYVFAAGDDPSRLTAGPVLFFLGSICIALYCTAATIIRQIIGTYTAAAKYLFPAIGYAVAAMTVICGLFIIQSHMTGALVTGHVICGLGFITACVSTAATSSTRFSLIPKNSGDSTFSVNPAGFTRGQSSLLIFIVSAIATGAWVWCILLFALGTLPAHIVAGSVMFGIACVCTSLIALVASIARQARGSYTMEERRRWMGLVQAAFSESGLIQYHLHESDGLIQIDAKGVSAHASMPALGVNAAGVTFACLAKAGFEDDFVRFYNSHIGTACDGSGLDLKFQDAYGDLTLCNGIVKTENGEISCTIDIRFPVTLSTEQICTMCQNRLEDSDGYIEIQNLTEPLFFPRESPLVESLYKAYTDVTGDTANEPLVIGGGTYAKSLKNIIAFGPEKPGMDYHIHGADKFLLVPEMEEAVLIYMEAIKNLLAI